MDGENFQNAVRQIPPGKSWLPGRIALSETRTHAHTAGDNFLRGIAFSARCNILAWIRLMANYNIGYRRP